MSESLEMNELKTWEDYYKLSQSSFEQGKLAESIGSYRRALILNPNLTQPSFLGQLPELSTIHIPAKQLNILPDPKTIETSEGFVISLAGNQNFVFYGPYIDIPDGFYRVQVQFDFSDFNSEQTDISNAQKGFKFDIAAPFPSIIYETEVTVGQNQLDFYLDFVDGERTEFRFCSFGRSFLVKSINLTLVYSPQNSLDTAFNYYFDLGNFLQLKSQTDKANLTYSKFLDIVPSEQGINTLLLNYKNIIPQHEWGNIYLSLANILAKKNRIEDAIVCYREVIERFPQSSSAYQRLALLLASQGDISEAVVIFQKAKKNPSETEIYNQIWRQFNHLSIIDDSLIATIPQISLETAIKHFQQEIGTYKVIDMNLLNDDSKAVLDNFNLCLANLELIQQDNLVLEEIYINAWSEQPISLAKKTNRKTHYQWHLLNSTRDYQQSIVETAYIYSMCPFSGTILRSNQSFYVQVHDGVPLLVYRFVGEEVFYLIVGAWSAVKIALYFPTLELLLDWHSWGNALEHTVTHFKANIVSNWLLVKDYISDPKPKKIASILGVVNNLGHYLWNYVTGIQYLYDNDIFYKLDKIISGKDSYYKIREIFPEITQDKIIEAPNSEAIFRAILQENCIGVMVTEFHITENLYNRIYWSALNQCKENQNLIRTLEEAKHHFPVVLINLRGHNKSWVNQVEGYANIINCLYQDYPNMAVFFDGFVDEQVSLDQILEAISPQVKVFNGLNCNIYETLLWVHNIDTYIAVIGSGLVLVNWLANKPGVTHGNKAHYSQQGFWTDVRENSISPIFLAEEFIEDLFNDPTSGNVYSNYNCDWKLLYNELINIIKSLEKKS